MIGKVKAVEDFRRTPRYVSEERESEAVLIYSNLPAPSQEAAEDPRTISNHYAQEMEAVAMLSMRVKKPCYHISLYPSQLDGLSKSEWTEFCHVFLEEVGLRDHQAVAYLHQDTGYSDGSTGPHAHLVVNRVDSTNGLAALTSWNYRRFEAAVRKLEADFDLTPTAPSAQKWKEKRKRVVRLKRSGLNRRKLCFSAAYPANPCAESVSSILTNVQLLRIFFASSAEIWILSFKVKFFCAMSPQIVASVVLGVPGMAIPEKKTASIEITCTPSQKRRLKAKAAACGAKSISQFILTLALEGRTDDFGFLRRKAEGALVNADTYRQLGELIEALQSRKSADPQLFQEIIALVHDTRRQIALNRLTQPKAQEHDEAL